MSPSTIASRSSDADLGVSAILDEIRYSDLGRISEQIAAFKRIPYASSGFPVARPHDCRAIIEALGQYLEAHRRAFIALDAHVTTRFFELIDQFANSAVASYPVEVLHLQVLRAEALILVGRAEEALTLVSAFAERPYQFEGDFGLVVKVMKLDLLSRLAAGHRDEVDKVSYGRLMYLVSLNPIAAPETFEQFFKILARPNVPWSKAHHPENLLRLLANVRLRQTYQAGGLSSRIIWRILGRFAMVGATALLIPRLFFPGRAALQLRPDPISSTDSPFPPPPTKAAPARDILVTRAMGGLGDLMMMTPGLQALAKIHKRPIYFATKRGFFPILENNPDIRLLDIDQVIPLDRFQRWYNLSNCPAGRYESQMRPNVPKGRVELFALGMQVRKGTLNRYGWRPICKLSPAQLAMREDFLHEHRAKGLPIIGVQPYSRDLYKNYPDLFAAVLKLAEKAVVVMFHSGPIGAPAHPNIVEFAGRPLRDSIAAISGCDYFLSVDSALYHVAAAFDIPCIGLFGPTSGKTFSVHHKRHLLVEAEGFGCKPCWRNEDIPCYVTGSQGSACMANISPRQLLEAVDRLMALYPRKDA